MKKGTHPTKESIEKNRLSHLGKPRAGNPENWKHTEKTKEKMRQKQLLNPTRYWLGKHRSDETKKKLKQKALKQFENGMPIKTRKKLSKKLKGKKGITWTKKQKEKASERMKGHIPWNKGKKGYNAGKKHYRWKENLTPIELINKIRLCPQYQKWRAKSLKRDNYTCQDCNRRGGKLEVHHKKEFIKIIEENKIKTFEQAINCKELWDLDNGKTLCKKCHNKTKYGRTTNKKI